MNGDARFGTVHSIYSALIGGMLAVFGAVVVFTWLVDPNGPATSSGALIGVVIGLASAAVYMAAGILMNARAPWLSGGLLFASGFTALWSGVLSLQAQPRWGAAIAFGVIIALGLALGWWRFGREGAAESGGARDDASV